MGRAHWSEDGFTLIELMVVILIIGILVAIAVPVFFSARSQGEIATCQDNLRTIDGVVSQYSARHGDWPTDISQLEPEFLREIPACPAGGVYSLSSTNPPWALCSIGHTY